MESRWYLSPGQTVETTRIEDRGHALHVTKDSWGKITAHLDRNRLIQEAIDNEQAHKLAVKEGSKAMTKDWDNSVENIRIRKEEERLARLEKSQDDKMQAFLALRKGQEVIRQKYIKDARKEMYISQGYPKTLTSALIQEDVLYQRIKQRELEEVIREHEREEEVKYAQKVKDGAEAERLEKIEAAQALVVKKVNLRNLYFAEMELKQKTEKALKEEKIALERLDTINGKKEMATIKKIEQEEDIKRRAVAKQELKTFLAKQKKAMEQMDAEAKEEDMVIEIYSQAKHRIACLRKKKEQEMQEATKARREAASKNAVAEAKAKMGNEERLIQLAQEKLDREELARLEADAAYQKRLTADREAYRRECLKREEEQKYEDREQQKWEMLNRFKQNEITTKYELDKKKRLWAETLQYRKELFEQMAENNEINRQKKEEIDTLYKNSTVKFEDDDNQFFEYADECLKYAKDRGRGTAAIERAILEYKKDMKLPIPRSKNCEDTEESKSPGHLQNPKGDTNDGLSNNNCKCK